MRIWLCILSLLWVACDREDDSLAVDGAIKTTLDGRALTTDDVSATINASSGSEILVVTANFPNGNSTTQLAVTAYAETSAEGISPGEYIFAHATYPGAHQGVCFYFLNDGNTPYGTLYVKQGDVGQVTITEVDRGALVVSGTFEATVGRNDDVKTFTKGSFTKVRVAIN